MTKKKENEQEMAICFLDILGFTEHSLSKPHEAEEDARKFRKTLKDTVLGIDAKTKKKEEKKNYLQNPQFSVISDSVFVTLRLVPEETSEFDLQFLIKDLSNTLLECLRAGIPLRGSISIGRAFHSRADLEGVMSGDHLVGVPVTQAARFEQHQEWVGISFVPEMYGNEPKELNSLITKGVVAEWGVPTESGLQRTWVVKWPEKELDEAILLLDKHYDKYLHPKEGKPMRGVAAKYFSTLVFLKHQRKGLGCENLSTGQSEGDGDEK